MKKIRIVFLLSAILFALTSCSKEDGPTGPAGPAGSNGTNGSNGNANVIMFSLPGITITDLAPNFNDKFALPDSLCGISLIVSYAGYHSGTGIIWYPLPGLTLAGSNDYRVYYYSVPTDPDSTTFYMSRVTGSGDDAIDSIKIIAVPASVLKSREAATLPNWKDCEEVETYFHLK